MTQLVEWVCHLSIEITENSSMEVRMDSKHKFEAFPNLSVERPRLQHCHRVPPSLIPTHLQPPHKVQRPVLVKRLQIRLRGRRQDLPVCFLGPKGLEAPT